MPVTPTDQPVGRAGTQPIFIARAFHIIALAVTPQHIPIPIEPSTLADFCARHRVRFLRVFGSVARGVDHPGSDIDILIEFHQGVDPDLFELGGLQQDLTDLFQRDVDLKTPEMFSPANLQRVLASSVLAFAA